MPTQLRDSHHRVWAKLLVATTAVFGCGYTAGGFAAVQAHVDSYGPAMNYRLHCEGCHKEDGTGQPGFVPALRGSVAQFLALPAGRAYLARVPGTAQSLLTDVERADVLNWVVKKFDAEHVPSDFAPYQAAELAQWRFDALSQPSVVRASLLAQLSQRQPTKTSAGSNTAPASGAATGTQANVATATPTAPAAQPPAAFEICGACHTVTPDGVPGIGPNLRGVVGRKPGSAAGFAYSPAMSGAPFTWTPTALNEFLTSPGDKVPGNYMTYPGVPDEADRAAIIAYLATLR